MLCLPPEEGSAWSMLCSAPPPPCCSGDSRALGQSPHPAPLRSVSYPPEESEAVVSVTWSCFNASLSSRKKHTFMIM